MLVELQTTQNQARIVFVALPAIAAVIAFGGNRLPASKWLVWITPTLGVIATLWSIRNHILVFL